MPRPVKRAAAPPDMTAAVRPALASCARIDEVVAGYTADGSGLFVPDWQVADIAAAAGGGVLARVSNGWTLRDPFPQLLSRCVIHGEVHYQLPSQWDWQQVNPQPTSQTRRNRTQT